MPYDIVIIGAGVMGSATAYYLSKTNKKVLLIDQYKIQNDLNSSQGYSRAFRYEYGEDEFYTKLGEESLKLWQELEKESKTQIYFQTGALLISEGEHSYERRSYQTLKKLGHPATLLLQKDQKKKYPQFSTNEAIIDHHGGVLDASVAVNAFIQEAKKNNLEIKENTQVTDIQANKITLADGSIINFKKLILTGGVWSKKLLDLPLTASKQQLVFFKPQDPQNFTKEKFPVFAYLDKGFYGFPIHGIEAVKISNHFTGEHVDPDQDDREVSPEFIQSCRDFFKKFIPSLADAEVIKTKVCFYNMTPDEDFIIDNYSDSIIIGAGFSGHGFKFAPLIGKILSDLATSGKTSQALSASTL